MAKERKRSPSGVDNKAIALRLMPEERKEAVELAGVANMTASAFARKVYLEGLPIVRKELYSTESA